MRLSDKIIMTSFLLLLIVSVVLSIVTGSKIWIWIFLFLMTLEMLYKIWR